MKLLLIDDKIEYKALINARQSDVDYILFNKYNDTYSSLIDKIKSKNTNYSDIGIVQHTDVTPYHYILRTELPLAFGVEPPYTSYNTFLAFLKRLKDEVGVSALDLISCSLYYHLNFRKIIEWLEIESGVNLRASDNFTGNGEDADWIMESDNVNVKDIYFTDLIVEFKYILYSENGLAATLSNSTSSTINRDGETVSHMHVDISSRPINPLYNDNATPFYITEGGALTSWGSVYGGFDSDRSALENQYPVKGRPGGTYKTIYATASAFAGLQPDGTVDVWGSKVYGGSDEDGRVAVYDMFGIPVVYRGKPAGLTSVVDIAATVSAFAALTAGGTVSSWGCIQEMSTTINAAGIGAPSSVVSGVKQIRASFNSFVALKYDSTVVIWGSQGYVANNTDINNFQCVQLYASQSSFAGVNSVGDAISFSATSTTVSINTQITGKNIKTIFSYANRFFALTDSGNCVMWENGGAIYEINGYNFNRLIGSTNLFCGINANDQALIWNAGGGIQATLSNVKSAVNTNDAIAVLFSNGTVQMYGSFPFVGDFRPMPALLTRETQAHVKAIYATTGAFVALRGNNQILVPWGTLRYGGSPVDDFDDPDVGYVAEYTGMTDFATTNFTYIYATTSAFAALRPNGSVYNWGLYVHGGARINGLANAPDNDYTAPSPGLTNIIAFYSNAYTFAAIIPSSNLISNYYYDTGASKKITSAPAALSANISPTSIAIPNTESRTLTVTSSSGTQPYTYVWKKGDEIIADQTSASLSILNDYQTADNAQTIVYTCIVSDAAGASITLTSNVTFLPYISLTATAVNPNPIVPLNSTTQLSLTVSNGKPPYTYSWTVLGDSTVLSTEATYDLSNNYLTKDISLNHIYICTVKDSLNLKTVNVQFNATFSPYYSLSATLTPGQDISLNKTESVTLTVTALNGIPPYLYEWYEDNELINPSSPPSYISFLNGGASILVTHDLSFSTDVVKRYTSIVKDKTNDSVTNNRNITFNKISQILAVADPSSIFIPYNNQTRTVRINVSNPIGIIQYTLKDSNGTIITNIPSTTGTTYIEYTFTNNYNYYINNQSLSFSVTATTLANGSSTANFTVIYEGYPAFDVYSVSTPPSELDYDNKSGQLQVDASGGKPAYSYQWYELSGTSEPYTLISLNNQTKILDLSNSYLYVGSDVTRRFRCIGTDSSSSPKTDSVDFTVLYKAYQLITASQNFTELILDVSENNALQIINVQGGKSGAKTGVYTYKWYYSTPTMLDLSAITHQSSNNPSLTYIDLSAGSPRITSIDASNVAIHNFPPQIEGHPRRIVYKCEISDLMNTNIVTLYFSVLYEAFYITFPCFDGNIQVLLNDDSYAKISELKKGDILYNSYFKTAYDISDVYIKQILINGNDSKMYKHKTSDEYYYQSATIKNYSLIYENKEEYSLLNEYSSNNETRQIFYHIVGQDYITNDVVTQNNIQAKTYGKPTKINSITGLTENYLQYDPIVGGKVLNFLYEDTLPDF